ncbi:MAG: ABC transporter ATP-binding protein [Candidatus Solibacter usitatus]|nr:ABC transporter ATP-binding protein [Candidatus Solibacter usitatus]
MGTVLELRGLSKRFQEQVALDDLNLCIGEGELFSLLGPSGCGKTTTLRLVAGFEEPTAGEVRLRGESLAGKRPFERNVSTVFQSYALFPHLTVRENIEFGLRYKRGGDGRRRVKECVEMLELGDKQGRKPEQLSGGEKQRVALARSLVVQPDVLLLDEPLSALDPNLRSQVRAELRSLQRRVGITFVFITHDQEEALSVSDRIALLNRGRLEQVGSPRDLYLRPASRFAAGFLGPVNWIDGIGVRPEKTRIEAAAGGAGARRMAATVESSTFLGNCLHVETRTESGQRVVAEVARLDGVQSGQRVEVAWAAEDEIRLPE